MFVILFMARSGSKYLRSLLNQHPDIHDFGEVFHNRKDTFLEQDSVLKVFANVALAREPVSGFQFRYPRHVNEFPEVFRLVESHPKGSLKLVLLKRRNKLKGAISQQNSEALKARTGKAHLFSSSAISEAPKLHVDVDRAVKEAKERAEADDTYLSWAKEAGFELTEVYYEDISQRPESEVNRVCRFLGCSPFKRGSLQQSDLVKVTSDRLCDAVENYDELKQSVVENGMSQWIDTVSPLEGIAHGERREGSSSLVTRFARRVSRRDSKRAIYDIKERTLGGRDFRLQVEALPVKTNTRFLEHVAGETAEQVIAAQDSVLRVSDDGCRSWRDVDTPMRFEKCFTSWTGTHLMQAKTGEVYRYDTDWSLTAQTQTGPYPWHGSWSIDQNKDTGTIIWGEYPYAADEVAVWRSEDDGQNWLRAFVQPGHPTDPKAGDIRHFHVVQKCTTVPDQWYLSSGDTEQQSRFWVSRDDGRTWDQVTISNVVGAVADIPEPLIPKLHRFTAMVQTESKLIWATDDVFKGRGAKVCVVDKADLSQLRVLDGNCGQNEIRNLIQLDDRYALAVSEAKLELESVYITLIDIVDEVIESTVRLPNESGNKSNFMNGISSRKATPGVFYSQTDNKVIRPCPMTTRWAISI